jgi:hypothetical protein
VKTAPRRLPSNKSSPWCSLIRSAYKKRRGYHTH